MSYRCKLAAFALRKFNICQYAADCGITRKYIPARSYFFEHNIACRGKLRSIRSHYPGDFLSRLRICDISETVYRHNRSALYISELNCINSKSAFHHSFCTEIFADSCTRSSSKVALHQRCFFESRAARFIAHSLIGVSAAIPCSKIEQRRPAYNRHIAKARFKSIALFA